MIHRPGRTVRALTITIVAAALCVAATVAAPVPARASTSGLPPSQQADLVKLLARKVEPLGLEITRGMLQDPATYKPDPHGTHLALYLAPTSPTYTDADYLRNFAKITRVFVPMVFDRWKGLQTFDICQEPVGDTTDEPPPVTQIFVSRDSLDRVGRWKSASLSDLLAAAPRDQRGARDYSVYFRADLHNDPIYLRAAAKAGVPPDPGGFGY